MIRAIAQEVGSSIERTMENLDMDEAAHVVGVDPARAQSWLETATSWLRNEIDVLGDEVVSRARASEEEHSREDDPLRAATPHPMDLPTEEQGVALAALESGRWGVEPGSDSLVSRGEGPTPSDALGLFRELRARDVVASLGPVPTPAMCALKCAASVLPRFAIDHAAVATRIADRQIYDTYLLGPIAPDVFCSSFKQYVLELASVPTSTYVIHVFHCMGDEET